MTRTGVLWVGLRLLSAGLLVGCPVQAVAQQGEGFVEATQAQSELNEEGVVAVNSGDYDKAISLFKASLKLGELNITFLNLGRTLAKSGRCQEAVEAYDSALSAPAVQTPSPEVIAQTIERFRQELTQQCPALITVVCEPQGALLEVDGQEVGPCPQEAVALRPGRHVLAAVQGEYRAEEVIEVEGMDRLEVSLTIEGIPVEPEVPEGPEVGASSGLSGWEIGGWSAVALGGAGLASALLVEQLVIAPDVDRLRDLQDEPNAQERFDTLKADTQTNQSLNLGLFVASSVLVASGVVMVLVGAQDDSQAPASAISPWLLPGGDVGVGWQGRW